MTFRQALTARLDPAGEFVVVGDASGKVCSYRSDRRSQTLLKSFKTTVCPASKNAGAIGCKTT